MMTKSKEQSRNQEEAVRYGLIWICISAFFLIASPFREEEAFFLLWVIVFTVSVFINRWGLLFALLTSAFLFAPTKSAEGILTLTDVILLLAVARVWFISRSRPDGLPPTGNREEWLLASLLLLGGFSLAFVAYFGGDVRSGAKAALRLLEYFLAYSCVARVLNDRLSIKVTENYLIALAVLFSLFGIAQWLIGPVASSSYFGWGPWWTEDYASQTFRVYSVFPNPIYFSAFCAFFVPLLFDLFMTRRGSAKLPYLLSLLVISIGLVLTFSRAGFLGALLGMSIVSGISWRKVLVLSVVVALVVLVVPTSELADRILLRTDDSIVNLYGRLFAYAEAMQVVIDNPYMGAGIGQYSGYVLDGSNQGKDPIVSSEVPTAENTVLQFGAELGLAGAVIVSLLATSMVIRARRVSKLKHAGSKGFLGGVCAWLFCNLFATFTAVSMMLFVIILLILAKRKYQLTLLQPQRNATAAA
ncbi:MAG: O-antigen ligase family protein [Acidobacteria bacterium]|nr:O-antigen ligase family protein [Acidobacteriota bacterium]